MSLSDLLTVANTDIQCPLNYILWMNDYKTYGESSYVFRNKDILHELYKSNIAANDTKICKEAFNFIVENEVSLFANAYDLKEYAYLLFNCTSISDITSNDILVNAVSSSILAEAFFECVEVIKTFATTSGLKTASSLENVMLALEASDIFKSAVVSNSDIQTISKSAAYNGGSITVNNAFVIDAVVGCSSSYANGIDNYAVGNCVATYHGEETTRLLVGDSISTKKNPVNLSLCKFVKNLTISPYYNGNFDTNRVSNYIKYIQLDNVI